MNTRNLNYYYYVEYFDREDRDHNGKIRKVDFQHPDGCQDILQDRNEDLVSYSASSSDLMDSLNGIVLHCLELQTIYPGLLIGTGIPHGFGGKGEAALGLCLDYVTGMPYIPGSSVKGVLRSAFKHQDYIKDILKSINVDFANDIVINELEARIFGDPINGKRYGVNPSEQDIFYDAIIVSEGKLLAPDAITPHRQDNELFELAAPNPLTIIRIRPGVTFRFQFSLRMDTLGISADQKLKLFKQILLDLGIGAKTNVGYGTLDEPKKEDDDQANIISDLVGQKTQSGICQKCGKPTKINLKTGEFYPICGKCQFTKKNKG